MSRIRLAVATDAAEAARLHAITQVGQAESVGVGANHAKRVHAWSRRLSSELGRWWVAEGSYGLVGMIGVTEVGEESSWDIEYLIVAPEAWRSGVSLDLLATAQEAMELGAQSTHDHRS